MPTDKLCALSVDLDEVHHYFSIHGLIPSSGVNAHAVYDRAVARFLTLAASERVPLTFFAVGADMQRPDSARVLALAAASGHEVANHTLDHRYDFSRLSRTAMRQQVEGGCDALQRVTGKRPRGFRAPGYAMTDRAYQVLAECGVSYSSSLLPCPLYYGAKVVALGLQRAQGRKSSSIVHSPAVLRAPLKPYRVGQPYWRRGKGLPELPISLTPGLRLPFIGTLLSALGSTGAGWLAKTLKGRSFVNLEFHGIDLLDERDGLVELRHHQPDVGLPLERKQTSFQAAIGQLRGAGYRFVTLREAALAVAL